MIGARQGRAKIEKEVYRQNRFAVMEILLEGVSVRLVGDLPTWRKGTWIEGLFYSYQHPRYGLTYKGEDLKEIGEPPVELSSWLYERLQLLRQPSEEIAYEALQNNPLALAPFALSRRLSKIIDEWPFIQAEYNLLKQGLSADSARQLRHLNPEQLRNNPYLLLPEGLPLQEADRVARRNGLTHLREQGLLLEHLLEEARLGHTCVELPAKEAVAPSLSSLVTRRGGVVGLKRLIEAEEHIKTFFMRRPFMPLKLAAPPSYLTAEQRALWPLIEKGHALLTGGPGTGKSYTCGALVEAAEKARLDVVLVAPTGKAAVRLTELTKRMAYTIHARLGWNGQHFAHGPDNPLKADLVVVDEASMADVELLSALLSALGPQTHLLLVGDADQLPPVGPGAPFLDLLKNNAPRICLTHLQRRAEQHPITAASYAVKEGMLPSLHNQSNLTWNLGELQNTQAQLIENVTHLYQLGTRPQVLCPVYRGLLGIDQLNKALKERLNPGGEYALAGLPIAVGDPLIQTRNDYSLGLANGQMMEVEAVDKEGLLVRLDDGNRQQIPRPAIKHLRHAYAISIHRSQGSQWPNVMIVLSSEHGDFPNREMFYTALTRAQSRVALYGDLTAYQNALKRRANKRSTWLSKELLKGA